MAASQTGLTRQAATPAPTLQTLTPFGKELFDLFAAGYSILHVHTNEETRAITEICRVASNLQQPLPTEESLRKRQANPQAQLQMTVPRAMTVLLWDGVHGFSFPDTIVPNQVKGPFKKFVDEKRNIAPGEAMRTIIEDMPASEHAIIVMCDLDDYTGLASNRRMLKHAYEQRLLTSETRNYRIVILSAAGVIPPKMTNVITKIEMPLPGMSELERLFEFMLASSQTVRNETATCDPELRENIIRSLQGLTSDEAENVLGLGFIKTGHRCTEQMLQVIQSAKADALKRSEVLTFIPEEQVCNPDELGGFDGFKDWLNLRRQAYSKEAEAAKLDLPKGVIILGVPGTAKSKAGMAASRILHLPLIIMDVGAVFGSLVGESEQRLRNALKQVEAQQGCVLLIDEADKAFGDAGQGGGDSGTTRRVFAHLLSWLAMKRSRTFVIMTMNRTTNVPAELLRPGRFDAVFHTDLPNETGRQQIFEIHMGLRSIDPSIYLTDKWDDLLRETNDFVGSEIEQVVVEARAIAFNARQSGVPTMAELVEAAKSVTPLAELDKDGLEAIRKFVHGRARPVTGIESRPLKATAGTKRRIAQPGQGDAGSN